MNYSELILTEILPQHRTQYFLILIVRIVSINLVHIVSFHELEASILLQSNCYNIPLGTSQILTSNLIFLQTLQLSSVTQSCPTLSDPWTEACQASQSITNSWSLLKFISTELVMPSNHLILCHPLLLPSIFPSIRVFPMSQFFPSGGQSNGVSASMSVLPMNILDWFP